MSMYAVLYRSQQAIGASNASLSLVPFTQDTPQNNKLFLQQDMKLVFATVFGVGVGFARIQTPYIINMGSLHLRPFGILATAGNNPNTADLSNMPTQFRARETIDVQTTNVDAGAQTHNALLQLWDGRSGQPQGTRLKILGTSVGPATAGVWSRITLTFQDNLPNLNYAIIGMEVFSATGILARLDIPGEAMRPGVPVVNAIQNRGFWKQYYLPFGVLGTFRNSSLPNLEIFCTAADAVFDVWLDVIAY